MPHRVVPPGEVLYPSGGIVPNIQIISPTAGDRWAIGSSQTIRWQGSDHVTIELLKNGVRAKLWDVTGNTWSFVVDGPADMNCTIKISDPQTLASITSGTFEIYVPVVIPLNAHITSVVPAFGLPDTQIVITGENFGTSGVVTIADGVAQQISWSNTQVVILVPTVISGPTNLVIIPAGNFVSDMASFIVGQDEPPPPPPPPDTMTSYAGLVRRINERCENVLQYGRMTRIADGITRHFFIPDRWVVELPSDDPDRLRCFVSDGEIENELVTGTSFDYESNWFHFDEEPVSSTSLRFDYCYRYVPAAKIKELINQAVDYLFPSFYVTAVRDFPASGKEYVVDSGGKPAEGIVDVQTGSEGDWTRLTPFRDYRVQRGEQQECLLYLFSSPSATVRVRSAFRARHLALDTDTLKDLGLPIEADECIILYVLWKLQAAALIPRMRYDQAVVTQVAGAPTVRDQQSTTQMYKLLLDIEIDKRKMRSWVARGI